VLNHFQTEERGELVGRVKSKGLCAIQKPNDAHSLNASLCGDGIV
jgi:hypothetical protein